MIYPKLTGVKPLEDFKLLLTFGDNEQRVYDFSPNLSHKFFNVLVNPALFKQVRIVDGEIAWNTGQDFCPHTLYDYSIPA